MKRIALSLFALSAIAPAPASARIGESLEQCTARYGAAVKIVDGVSIHHKNGIRVMVEYMDGKCGSISYAKLEKGDLGVSKSFTSSELEYLRKLNGTGWDVSRTQHNQWTTRTPDDRIAEYMTGERMLAIATIAFVKWRGRQLIEAKEKALEGL